jgi:hypothetical protein
MLLCASGSNFPAIVEFLRNNHASIDGSEREQLTHVPTEAWQSMIHYLRETCLEEGRKILHPFDIQIQKNSPIFVFWKQVIETTRN